MKELFQRIEENNSGVYRLQELDIFYYDQDSKLITGSLIRRIVKL